MSAFRNFLTIIFQVMFLDVFIIRTFYVFMFLLRDLCIFFLFLCWPRNLPYGCCSNTLLMKK